jgi:hypothetical protein
MTCDWRLVSMRETELRKERMNLSSFTRALRNCAAPLVSLALVVTSPVGWAHQKQKYQEYPIVSAYRHYDQHQLKRVQIALRQQGFYSGAADGFLGYKTDIAISKFQLEHQHPVRPIVDQWLLVTLGIVKPVVD